MRTRSLQERFVTFSLDMLSRVLSFCWFSLRSIEFSTPLLSRRTHPTPASAGDQRESAGRARPRWLCVGLCAALLAGCSGHPRTADDAAAELRKAQVEKQRAAAKDRDDARQQLDQIPPPAKSRYLAVHTQDSWENPFLIVGRETVNLRVIHPGANPSGLGQGGMLRPSDARQQTVDVRLQDLPKALAAIPENAWPYGRVIAVEEGTTLAKADRPQVRRNVEATIQLLNDLGIVVDEWTGPSGSLLR